MSVVPFISWPTGTVVTHGQLVNWIIEKHKVDSHLNRATFPGVLSQALRVLEKITGAGGEGGDCHHSPAGTDCA